MMAYMYVSIFPVYGLPLAHPSLNRFSYYGIAASALLSILNYLLLGFALEVDGFYLHSYVRFTRIHMFSLHTDSSSLASRSGSPVLLSSPSPATSGIRCSSIDLAFVASGRRFLRT